MRKRRLEYEKKLMEEDAKKAAEDPNYKPRFMTKPDGEEPHDANQELKKRLEEERRKHREELEEQLEDDLLDEDDYDSEYEGEYDWDYELEYDDEEEEEPLPEYDTNLDYYYDE